MSMTGAEIEFRLLIIDDEQAICDILQDYLSGRGYRVDSATRGRQWMRELAAQVTSAAPWKSGEKPDSTLNVAVSYRGLEALGLAASSLESFPEAFRQGMAERAGLLGDVGPDSPEHWEAGLRKPPRAPSRNAPGY